MQTKHTAENTDASAVKVTRIVRTAQDLESLRCLINDGYRIEGVEGIDGKYSIDLLKLCECEKEIWGESFNEYAQRVFVGVELM
jgi:hypothetical protein